MATGLVILGTSAHLAGGVGTVLGIDPGGGPNGTPYRVTVTCQQKPTLYGHGLADSPPPTQIPRDITQSGPDVWTLDAVGYGYDDWYFAVCGNTTEEGRFNTNAPRLYLGPVPNHSGAFPPWMATAIEGTDCPDGTTAQVAITVDGAPAAHTAAIDQYGDWAVDLPARAGTKEMSIEASCGSVAYSRFLVTTTTPTPTIPTTPTTETATTDGTTATTPTSHTATTDTTIATTPTTDAAATPTTDAAATPTTDAAATPTTAVPVGPVDARPSEVTTPDPNTLADPLPTADAADAVAVTPAFTG